MPLRWAFAVLLLSLSARAETLEPQLVVETAGNDLLLVLCGNAQVSNEIAGREPLVHAEFFFVPIVMRFQPVGLPGGLSPLPALPVQGEPVSLGFRRATILPDAVVDPETGRGNPPLLTAEPLRVTGRFPGLYRVRLVLDPARQNGRLRGDALAPARAWAEAAWGKPEDWPQIRRRAGRDLSDDIDSARHLAVDLEDLWVRLAQTRDPAGWKAALDTWRARAEPVRTRNARRPAHAILDFMPALRAGLEELLSALEARATLGLELVALDPARRASDPRSEPAASRVRRALDSLARSAAPEPPAPEDVDVQHAWLTLREAPLALSAWHSEWSRRAPGRDPEDWRAFAARLEAEVADALFTLARALPPERYLDLATAGRLLFSPTPVGAARQRSLLSTYGSRILKEVDAPIEAAWIDARRSELQELFDRLFKALPRSPK